LDCIKTGSKPETGGLEGLQVVQILEAASKSLKNDGALVKIDRVDPMEFSNEHEAQVAAVAQ
jgi:hypothetical protein